MAPRRHIARHGKPKGCPNDKRRTRHHHTVHRPGRWRAGAGQGSFGGSVPATTAPPLPPVDPEADRLIAEQFSRYPEARYRLTQLAFIQEHALAEAQNRIQRLEWEVQQARQAAPSRRSSSRRSGSGGGFFSGLFGGGRARRRRRSRAGRGRPGTRVRDQRRTTSRAPPPPPQYAPGYQQGMFQRQGSGFLGSALTTAAGVAGGLVAGNALMSLFSGSHGMGGGFGGGFGGGAGRRAPGAPRRRRPTRAISIRARGPIRRAGLDRPGLCRQRHLGHLGRQPVVLDRQQRRQRSRLGYRRWIHRRYILRPEGPSGANPAVAICGCLSCFVLECA